MMGMCIVSQISKKYVGAALAAALKKCRGEFNSKEKIMVKRILMCFLIAVVQSVSWAEVSLPHVFSDNMVLQQGMPIPVWGWADPGEHIAIALAAHNESTKADAGGCWTVKLPAMKAGGSYQMTVSGKNTVIVKNILIGEVWVCSGQSNMDFPLHMTHSKKSAVSGSGYPNMRLFKVPRKASAVPESDVDASWKICDRRAAMRFSGVGFFFGREIHEKIKVPVGLIQSSVGGTKIESWTPREGVAAVAGLEQFLKEIDKADSIHKKNASQPAPKRCRHPLRLWNGMVHPLVPFAVRGALWYQGEANVKRPAKYALNMKALIGGWRSAWGQQDFSFYYVQLPPYSKNDQRLCLIQEAQLESLSIPNTGMIVTTDLIESDRLWDHHPKNKKDVGKRLALWALARDYGCKDIVFSGPLYKSMSVQGRRIRIMFDHTGSGLATRDGKSPDSFEVAGRDKKFVKADTGIDGNCVLVWSNTVPAPAAVRFGWHQEAQPNLINKEGLPASPFRTHKW